MNMLNPTNLIKLITFIGLILYSKKLFLYNGYIHPFYLPNKKPILSIDKNKKKILKKGKKYLNKCLAFHTHIKYKRFLSSPKVTIIIPLYNCESTIRPSLHSVQFQNISNIEIIIINDFSTDNTSKIIKFYQKYDSRIRIINNHKNMGTLYSRSIGALISKGEYIFNLDDDDLYFDNDILDYIFRIGKQESLDIISFLTVNIKKYNSKISKMENIFTYQYPNEFYLQQPELGIWMVKFKNKFLVHNNMIWDKCIKTSIYKKAVNLMGFQKYSRYLSWAEDASIIFIIFNLAKSFKNINKYGIFHFKGNNTATKRQSNNTRIFGEIFFLDIIFDFTKNDSEDKNLIIGQAIYLFKRYNFYKFII